MKITYEKITLISITIGPDLQAIAMYFIILQFTIVNATFINHSASSIAHAIQKITLIKVFCGYDFDSSAIGFVLCIYFAFINAIS